MEQLIQAQGQNYMREDDHVVLEIPLETIFHPNDSTSTTTPTDHADRDHTSDEEAICRICFDDLSEGGETLVMECSCQGELALAHRQCAIKWFSHKRNNTCEVCHHVVQNLPIDLLTIPSTTGNQVNDTTANHHIEVGTFWGICLVWQESPALILASMLAYFFIGLNYLVKVHVGFNVGGMGENSVVISILYACVVGSLSAMISAAVARGRFVWLYAVVQFIWVVVFAYTLRFVVKLAKNPILSMGLATIMGFVVAICCGYIVLGGLRLRTWWLQQRQQGANN